MPMTADDLADIKPKLEAAKKSPINFGVCLGTTPKTTVILFSKTKDGAALEKLAKKAGDSNKTTFGTMSVTEGVLTLACAADVPSGLCKKVRGLLASLKIGMKVRALDPSGAPADLDDDDDAPPALVAETPATEPESAPTDAVKPPGWDKIVATVGPRVVALVKAGSDKAQSVANAWKMALAAAEAGRAAEAMTIVNKIMPLLRAPPDRPEAATTAPLDQPEAKPPRPEANAPTEPKPASKAEKTVEPAPAKAQPDPATDAPQDNGESLEKAARLWRESVKAMRAEMQKLQDAIVAHLAPDPALADIADDTRLLAVRLDVFDLDLADMLEAAARLEPEARDGLIDDARDTLDNYQEALGGRFFSQVDDANGFTKVAVAATARKSLAAIEKLLA